LRVGDAAHLPDRDRQGKVTAGAHYYGAYRRPEQDRVVDDVGPEPLAAVPAESSRPRPCDWPAPDGVRRPAQGGSPTADGRVEVVIRGTDEYVLTGELAGLVEWLEVTRPPGVRVHLASIGKALLPDHGQISQ
jgi:hypothetical protein